MLKHSIILVVLILLVSCSQQSYDVQWGPDPKQKCDDWLTFDYNQARYFYDTSGTLWKYIQNDSLIGLYIATHKGTSLTSENVKNLDAILSCKMFCGSHEDSVSVALNNPEHLVTFTKDNKITGYVSADFYSRNLTCMPATKSEELCALKYLFQSIRRH